MIKSKLCLLCGHQDAKHCVTISKRPAYETDYGIPENKYFRSILLCKKCGVFLNDHCLLPESFYQGDYNDITYADRWNARFQYIMSLPFEKSDNKQRVFRIHNFLQKCRKTPAQTRVLDIGSGLGVFSAEMLRYTYITHVLDPDFKSVQHARDVIGVNNAWQGSVEKMESYLAGKSFDFIALNKVLEHLHNPLRALKSLHPYLEVDGYVYIELPDGEAALKSEGIQERQEFCIDHLTIYSLDSFTYLVESANFQIIEMQRIHEPSGKFTIYAFVKTR